MAEKDQLKDHCYDGIQEYDNDLPRWWLAILYLSVAWAVAYGFWYHVKGAPLGPRKLQIELTAAMEERAKKAGSYSEDDLRAISHLPERVAKGKQVFVSAACATCHTAEATGNIGPNLRDDFWIHGSDMTAIVASITEGRAGGAMPEHKSKLSQSDIISVAAYIADLNRSSKAPGKAPDPAKEKETPITW